MWLNGQQGGLIGEEKLCAPCSQNQKTVPYSQENFQLVFHTFRGRRDAGMKTNDIIPSEIIEKQIFLIRGQKVMLDFHLAELYNVPTKSLNLAVKRNTDRFPPDFMFQLTDEEYSLISDRLRFQIETSKQSGRGGRRYVPYAFSEQGVAMLSSVLRSKRAVQVNIEIMRAFVKLRELLSSNKDLAHKLEELEKKYDKQFQIVFDAIRQILTPPEKPKRSIGFHVEEPAARYKAKKDAAR
jgi:hypothetical protein